MSFNQFKSVLASFGQWAIQEPGVAMFHPLLHPKCVQELGATTPLLDYYYENVMIIVTIIE